MSTFEAFSFHVSDPCSQGNTIKRAISFCTRRNPPFPQKMIEASRHFLLLFVFFGLEYRLNQFAKKVRLLCQEAGKCFGLPVTVFTQERKKCPFQLAQRDFVSCQIVL